MVMPSLDFDAIANVTGSAAMRSGDGRSWVGGGKSGNWTRSQRDSQDIPGFNVPDHIFAQDNDDTSRYPKNGYREVPPLTSGRPRVRPTVGPSNDGGNVASYPVTGVKGAQGSTDSAGDDYRDDSAPAGLGAAAAAPRACTRPRQTGGRHLPRGQPVRRADAARGPHERHLRRSSTSRVRSRSTRRIFGSG